MILSSGMGLGVYVPSLIIRNKLKKQLIDCELLVLEDLFTVEKQNKIEESKVLFHKSYKVAVVGHKIGFGNMTNLLDEEKVSTLIEKLQVENSYKFIVMFGGWSEIINRYYKVNDNLYIDAIHMDVGVTPSWKKFNCIPSYNDIWIYDTFKGNLTHSISITDNSPYKYNNRPERFIMHGGGWGMGTHITKVEELKENNIKLNIVVYDKEEINYNDLFNNFFYIDSDWKPWNIDTVNKKEFPTIYKVKNDGKFKKMENGDYHCMFDEYMNSKAIISKAGGGTLLDSFSSCTPIIFTDPIARHEELNEELWLELGFGIKYDKWKELGFDIKVLEKLHKNIRSKQENTVDYVEELKKRWNLTLE